MIIVFEEKFVDEKGKSLLDAHPSSPVKFSFSNTSIVFSIWVFFYFLHLRLSCRFLLFFFPQFLVSSPSLPLFLVSLFCLHWTLCLLSLSWQLFPKRLQFPLLSTPSLLHSPQFNQFPQRISDSNSFISISLLPSFSCLFSSPLRLLKGIKASSQNAPDSIP